MRQQYNDEDDTISLEEELDEEYEPTDQEIREFALQIGMHLPQDNQYLDIAKAGLKARLPDEWKICQKTKKGQQLIYYKNRQTGEETTEHPCDIIYRKKYREAKQLDLKKPASKKASGVNKLKQNIQMYRSDDEPKGILEGPDDQSFLMEASQLGLNYGIQNPSQLLQNSATQNLLQTVDFEFANKISQYEESLKQEQTMYQDELNQKLSKMEIMLMNEADPQVFELREELIKKQEEKNRILEEKKAKIKKKVDSELNEKLIAARSALSKQQERALDEIQYEKEKEMKNKLRLYEQELEKDHKDILRKISIKQKELQDIESRQGKEVQDKKKQVLQNFEKYKNQLKQEQMKELYDLELDTQKQLRQQKDLFQRTQGAENQQKVKEQKFMVLDMIESYNKQVQGIKDSFIDHYEPYFENLRQKNLQEIMKFEQDLKQDLSDSVVKHNESFYQNRKNEMIQKLQRDSDQYNLNLQTQLAEMERLKQQQMFEQKKQMEDNQRKRLYQIQTELEKKYGIKAGGKEVEMCMEQNNIKIQIQESNDNIKNNKKKKETVIQKSQQLKEVIQKFDILKELNQQEVLKYELENKKHQIQQLQNQSQNLQKDVEIYEQQFKNEQLQKDKINQTSQIQQLMNNVGELKEMIFSMSQVNQEQQKKSYINPKGKAIKIEDNLSLQESIVEENPQQQIRQWNLVLVEERVKINKKKENLKSQKLEIKIQERKLLSDQDGIKKQIRMFKLTQQKPDQKDLIKKIKKDVQKNLMNLSQEIIKLNDLRTQIKMKESALDQLEKVFQEKQNQPRWIQSMDSLFQQYQQIGENIIQNIQYDEQQTPIDSGDSNQKNQNQNLLSSQYQQKSETIDKIQIIEDHAYQTFENQAFQTFEPKNMDFLKNFNKKPVKYYGDLQSRLDLISSKEWHQNQKYRLNVYDQYTRDNYLRYQQFIGQGA
ncbi:hypothetical protein pb186bvf_003954 [Paramecium bursaria]